MKFDKTKPHATVTGIPGVRYEQNGVLYSGTEDAAILAHTSPQIDPTDRIIQTDDVESARAFLKHVLSKGPLSKAAVYKVSSENNQNWNAVKNAATLEGVITYQFSRTEMWKLREKEEV